jgi:hypothetical protein
LIVQGEDEIRIAMNRSFASVASSGAAAPPASYYYPKEAGTG